MVVTNRCLCNVCAFSTEQQQYSAIHNIDSPCNVMSGAPVSACVLYKNLLHQLILWGCRERERKREREREVIELP